MAIEAFQTRAQGFGMKIFGNWGLGQARLAIGANHIPNHRFNTFHVNAALSIPRSRRLGLRVRVQTKDKTPSEVHQVDTGKHFELLQLFAHSSPKP